MSYSANEISALARKAAVGAGFPHGQADQFGQAVAVHLGAGRAPEAVLAALDDPEDSPILRLPLLMDDVLRAVALTGSDVSLTLHPGDDALALAYARLLPVRLVECRVEQRDGAQPRLAVLADPETPSRPALPPRIAVPDALHARLGTLAARTYVPASAGSRQAGAGAGDIDND